MSFVQPPFVLARAIVAAASLLALSAAPMAQATQPSTQELDSAYEVAMEAYSVQHFKTAYQRFTALADFGHAEAARVALFMHRFGKSRYGVDLPATRAQRDAWVALLAPEPSPAPSTFAAAPR